jgi:monothiol glutaredoxin
LRAFRGSRAAGAYNSRWYFKRKQEQDMSTQDTIRNQVTSHPVVLYMKGSPQFPMCGFSASAAQILKACGVEKPFTVDVLQDAEIRQGIKEFANWPTIPQLYVKGEFVGGADIMREMYQSGELQKLLEGVKA